MKYLLDSNLMKTTASIIRKLVNKIGVDIVRLNESPNRSLLGIKHLPVKTIIDIGANTGQFANFIMKYFPDAQLICFEPLKEQFVHLENWTQRNTFRSPILFNIALGENIGKTTINYHYDHSPSSSILESTITLNKEFPQTCRTTKYNIRIDTLDNVLSTEKIQLEPEILVKIDVQGYEDRVIRGGKLTLQKSNAVIIEVNLESFYQDQASFAELLSLLEASGLNYSGVLNQAYGKYGEVAYFDALFTRRINK